MNQASESDEDVLFDEDETEFIANVVFFQVMAAQGSST